MASDEGEDYESVSIKKEKKKSGLLGLLVKLKIPKEEGNMDQIDENKDDEMKRICSFCQKTFSSGKALGGHMRIHVQHQPKKLKPHHTITFKKHDPREDKVIDFVKKKKKKAAYCDSGSGHMIKKPTCTICGKDFPSMKSLFGHLRCHPDRNWRGINPPSSNTTCSSSSSLSDGLDSDKMVDLMESLSWGWSVTARRGRKALSELSSSEDDQIREAVKYLMMLSRGDSPDEQRGSNEAVNIVNGESVNNMFSDDDDNEYFGSSKFEAMKKKTKRMKLCDLQLSKNASSAAVVVMQPAHDEYKCNACDKSFPTYQALGGHRSSCHNNKFNVGLDKEDDDDNILTCDVNDSETPATTNTCLDFDLNEDPPSEDEARWI